MSAPHPSATFWILRIGHPTTDNRVIDQLEIPGWPTPVRDAANLEDIVGSVTRYKVDADGWLIGDGWVHARWDGATIECGLDLDHRRMRMDDDGVLHAYGTLSYVKLGDNPCWAGCRLEVQP